MAKAKTDEPILQEALEKFEESHSSSDQNRREAHDDIVFSRLAKQWPDEIVKQRQAEGRPCLTINRLLPLIRQVVNDARQNTPSVQVSPVDSGADVDTANVIGGLIRRIQNGRRKADIAYDTAIEHAVSGGFGFFRVGIDFVSPDSFDMEAYIDRVPNPLMVHWDVSSTEFDSSDWDYAFVSDFLTQETFKKRYPDASPVSFEGSQADMQSNWSDDDRIRVAEYFTREENKRTLYRLSDGRDVRKDALPDIARRFFEAGGVSLGGQVDDDEITAAFMQVNGLTIARQREAKYHKVMRRIINGVEVLEEDEWPGSTIPICPVWGDEVIIDGRRHFRSLIRDAKDPQLMFNYWRTAATELVALAPKAPFIIPKGGIPKGSEADWASANTRSFPYLEYDASKGPMPQRQGFAGVPAGALNEAMTAADDMKSITGIFDSSIGAESNEKSGKAILARERQSNASNFHFVDNLNRAVEACGRILVEIIPAVYSEQQTIRILGEDSREQVIHLTQQDGGSSVQNEEGTGPQLYNLSVGRYDVSVSTGANFATAREQTRDTLIEIMRQVPGSATVIGDILAENMDFPGSDKLAKRLQVLLPPQIQAAESGQPMPQPIPGQVPGNPAGQPPMSGMMPVQQGLQ